MIRTRATVTRGILTLAGGLVVVGVGAWLVARGLRSTGVPLWQAWRLGWTWLSGGSASPAPVLQAFTEPLLWFGGAVVALLIGWAMILRAADRLWRVRTPPDAGDPEAADKESS